MTISVGSAVESDLDDEAVVFIAVDGNECDIRHIVTLKDKTFVNFNEEAENHSIPSINEEIFRARDCKNRETRGCAHLPYLGSILTHLHFIL